MLWLCFTSLEGAIIIFNMVYEVFTLSLFGIALSDHLKGDGIKLLPYLFDFPHMLSIWIQFDQRLVDWVNICRVLSMVQHSHTLR